jgi:hypothetical protein
VPVFVAATTSVLGSWLALTAQLPLENYNHLDTIVGLFLSIGSPALVTFALVVTMLNRRWAIGYVKGLSDRSKLVTQRRFRVFNRRLHSFLCLALEGQQVPLRATQVRHRLSSLVVSPRNQAWWIAAQDHVLRSRRKATASLIAQVFLAAVVWFLTIVSSLLVATGTINTALQVAVSTLWVWLVSLFGNKALHFDEPGTDSEPRIDSYHVRMNLDRHPD